MLRRNQATRIQRIVKNFINGNRTMSTFELYVYDKNLDLTDSNDQEFHETASARLKDNGRFDGSLDKANKFLNLFGKNILDCRLKVLLEIVVE